MFTTLLESRAVPVRRGHTTTLSVALHAALVAAAVAITVPRPEPASRIETEPPITFIQAHPTPSPTQQAAPATGVTHTVFLPTPVRIDVIPVATPFTPIVIEGPTVPVDQLNIGGSDAFTAPPGALASGGGASGNSPVDVAYVERIPRILGDAPQPRYPSALRSGGVSGHVIARFVVDTLGRAEMGSLDLTDASHALFADAVRDALSRYRFSPGELGGRRVRTMVQIPFAFTLK